MVFMASVGEVRRLIHPLVPSTPGKLKVLLFCGGSGGKDIIQGLTSYPFFDVSVMVNAYDDGKSTGYLRRIIPGFLGPSDIRKNYSHLIDPANVQKRILKDIIEYRFPNGVDDKKALQDLHNIVQGKSVSISDLEVLLKKVIPQDATYIRIYIKALLDYLHVHRINFDFEDCSFGNLLLAGCYIKNGENINIAIDEMYRFLEPRGHVYNVTKGENLFLTAVTEDGDYLPSEASIVERHINSELAEIFLFSDYLSEKEAKKVKKLPKQKKIKYLRTLEIYPELDERSRKIIEESDVIIYAPGTQNSSLFPTYLTKGFAEAVRANTKAKKIFITNIGGDNEIPKATAEDLIEKALYYFNRKGELSYTLKDLADYYFINAGNEIDPKYIKFVDRLKLGGVIHDNFEKEYSGRHDGKKIVEKIIQAYSMQDTLPTGIHKLSIVIPGYNEGRFIETLLNRIKKVDFSDLGFLTEIIFVDDGSTDNTSEIMKNRTDVKYIRSPVNRGKGNSVILGIKAATGNVIVIQDSDLEYNPEDIKEMLRAMLKYRYRAVYGSRVLKRGMRAKALSILYGKRPGAYWSYYVGGQLLTFVALTLYGALITDTVTGYKMVDARLLKSFTLKSRGFELDHEITAKILKRGCEIFEIPVSYTPRSKAEGKKIKWKDGFIAIKTLFKFRFRD